MNRKLKTDFLTATSSILIGMGSIGNLSGGYYSFNLASNGAEADRIALSSDWGMTGRDLRVAMRKVSNEERQKRRG